MPGARFTSGTTRSSHQPTPFSLRRVFRIIFFAVDGLLIAFFIAGYLAYYVRPGIIWWIELIAVFLPFVAVLLVAAALVLLVRRRWLLAAVHGVLLIAMVLRSDLVPRAFDPVEERDDDLVVLSYNVPRWWGYEMPAKTAEMAGFIDAVDPDVLSLQEAPIEYHNEDPPLRAAPYVAVLFDSLGFRTAGPRAAGATWTPQPVLARLEVVQQADFRLKQLATDSVSTRVTRTHLRWKDRDFAVYNVHLRTFGEKKPWRENRLPLVGRGDVIPYLRTYREAYRTRAWEVEEILKMIRHEAMPVILCGDLNSTPYNWVHARLTTTLRDTFEERGQGWGMTYHTRLPIFRIDYVLVSEEWEIVSADVVDAYLSDHLPVRVKLRWKE